MDLTGAPRTRIMPSPFWKSLYFHKNCTKLLSLLFSQVPREKGENGPRPFSNVQPACPQETENLELIHHDHCLTQWLNEDHQISTQVCKPLRFRSCRYDALRGVTASVTVTEVSWLPKPPNKITACFRPQEMKVLSPADMICKIRAACYA